MRCLPTASGRSPRLHSSPTSQLQTRKTISKHTREPFAARNVCVTDRIECAGSTPASATPEVPMSNKALMSIAVIRIQNPPKEESVGDKVTRSINEGAEEVADEIDDHTDDK